MKTLSILHLLSPGAVGGLESVVRLLAGGHAERGHRVHVAASITLDSAPPGFLEALRQHGVTVTLLELPARAYVREHMRLSALCAQIGANIIHTHGYRSDVMGAVVARRAGVSVLTTVHGFTGGGRRNRLYERLQEWSFRRFDAVVAVSRSVAQRLDERRVPAERLHVIQNAYARSEPPLERSEARRVLGLPADRFVLGWVGRFSHEKGPDVMIDALAIVRDLPLHVAMIGGGREESKLRARTREAGIDDRVSFHGVRPGAERLFPAFDAFVLSSRTEGTPMVLFEAMASHTPIVATLVGGVPDVVSEGEALLVPVEAPAALASALRILYSDSAGGCTRAVAAYARLTERYAVTPWLDRYEALYQSLLHRPSK